MTLAGIPWQFHRCPSCAGLGTVRRPHDQRHVRLGCKTCAGTGYIRQRYGRGMRRGYTKQQIPVDASAGK